MRSAGRWQPVVCAFTAATTLAPHTGANGDGKGWGGDIPTLEQASRTIDDRQTGISGSGDDAGGGGTLPELRNSDAPKCADLEGWQSASDVAAELTGPVLDCTTLSMQDFCTRGAEGFNWPLEWGNLSAYVDINGTSAYEACCGCGGGSGPTGLEGCSDVSGFVNSYGENCYKFWVSDYCNSTGGYGTGWDAAFGAFEDPENADVQDPTFTVLNACCACGGGVEPTNTATERPSTTPTGAPTRIPSDNPTTVHTATPSEADTLTPTMAPTRKVTESQRNPVGSDSADSSGKKGKTLKKGKGKKTKKLKRHSKSGKGKGKHSDNDSSDMNARQPQDGAKAPKGTKTPKETRGTENKSPNNSHGDNGKQKVSAGVGRCRPKEKL